MQYLAAVRILCLLSCLASLLPTALAQQPAAAVDFHSDPKFQKYRQEALDQKLQHHGEAALDSWKKAIKASGNRCVECYEQVIVADMGNGQAKHAAEAAKAMDAAALTPKDHAQANYYLGMTLLAQGGDKPKPGLLNEAHTAFQNAIKLSPNTAALHYQDGRVLALLDDDTSAAKAFAAYLQLAPADASLRTRAAHFAADPALARLRMAPPLVVSTLDGRQFNLDSMSGKVVLIDFWATWCGPCNRELPNMQKLAQHFAGEPFEMISVSDDKDEAKWKEFVASHGMNWHQYRDADGALGTAFGVSSIPRYFTIDTDGVLTSVEVGEGSDIEGRIRKLLKKARESAPPVPSRAVASAAANGQGS